MTVHHEDAGILRLEEPRRPNVVPVQAGARR